MIRAAASLTGLTAILALVLYLTLGDGDSSPTDPSPTLFVENPSPSATPKPIVATSPTPTPVATPLPKFASQIPFPENTALILGTGCYGCDGPTSGLRRIYRDPAGSIRIDQILSVDQLDVERRDDNGKPYITGLAVSPDGSEMMVSVCIADNCGAGGLFGWGADSAVAIFRSTDGGVTWTNVGEFEGGIHLRGLLHDGLAYGYWYESSIEEDPSVQPTFALFPSLERLIPPPGGVRPAAAIGGRIVWSSLSDDRVPLYSDGSKFRYVEDDAGLIFVLNPYTADADVPVIWTSRFGEYSLSLVGPGGNARQTVALPSNPGPVIAAGPRHVFTNVSVTAPELGIELPPQFFGQLPALVNMEAGTIHPISDHLQPDERNARDSLIAVQIGPFARVVDTRSCLNLRTSPGLDATKVGCLADGVLLRHDSVVVTNQDVEWLQVTAPDGTPGWAATEFLEY